MKSSIRVRRPGFTIVELLIVIMIIGILAAVVIASYSRVQERAQHASVRADMKQAATRLEVLKAAHGDSYPASVDSSDFKPSQGNSFSYQKAGDGYCLEVQNNRIGTYFRTHRGTAGMGPCPVGYWSFDGSLDDSSPYGTAGFTSTAQLAPDRNGRASSAYSLTPGTITIPDADHLDLSSQLTVAFWLKLNNYGTYYSNHPVKKALGTTDSNFTTYLFGNYQGNNQQGIVRFYGSPSGTWTHLSGSHTLNTGRWYHIALSYDENTGGRLYVDGIDRGGGGTGGPLSTNSYPVTISLDDGVIDDVRLYDRALAPAEVLSMYEQTEL